MKSLSHLIFPEVCLHCKEMIEENKKFLCSSCYDQLIFLKQEGRCMKCFGESSTRICAGCRRYPPSFKRFASCFEAGSPAQKLFYEFRTKSGFSMAKDLAAFMAFQFFELQWPLPDYLIPLPLSPIDSLKCGYQPHLMLAQKLGAFIERPIIDVLKKSFWDDSITFKKKIDVSDRVLLLIADEIQSLEIPNRCSELLMQGATKAIYIISFLGFF